MAKKYTVTGTPTFAEGSRQAAVLVGDVITLDPSNPEHIAEPDGEGDVKGTVARTGEVRYIALSALTETPEPEAFKPGDKVRVLPGEGWGAIASGREYTVRRVSDGFVYLAEPDSGSGWYPSRFELVAPEPEPTPARELLDADAARDVLTMLGFDEAKIATFVKLTTAQPE